MMMHENGRHPTRGDVSSLITDAWYKCIVACIKNTWRSVGHFVPGEYGDPDISTSKDAVSFPHIPPIFGIDHNGIEEDKEKEDENEGEGALFSHHMGNILDVDDEEPLFVV
jgi:hypothetical protein